MGVIKKLEQKEQERILLELRKAKPGTREYAELQKQLGAFTIMEEKRSSGKVKAIDYFKFGTTLISTGLLVTADQWFPLLSQKLKLSEFVSKALK